MKVRFTTVDIMASVGELRKSAIGSIISSIYDVNAKTYLFKLKKPEGTMIMLIESGCRIHSTEYNWPKSLMPSTFTMKLRKHLRNRKLHEITQLGVDRIVRLTVGSGDRANHVFVELFDRGNIILCDRDYQILMALRWRRDADNNIICGTGHKYDASNYRTLQIKTEDDVKKLTMENDETVAKFITRNLFVGNTFVNGLYDPDVLKKRSIDLDPGDLLKLFEKGKQTLKVAFDGQCKGYISYEQQQQQPQQLNSNKGTFEKFDQFFAFEFENVNRKPLRQFENFSKATDEFFSKICQQKIETESNIKEKAALKKVTNVEEDIENRCAQLIKDQADCERKAKLVESELELVDAAIAVIRNAVSQGLGWDEVEEMVDSAKSANNAVAKTIDKLDLAHRKIFIRFQDDVSVAVDYSVGAYANVRMYYDTKKSLKDKENRTRAAMSKALQAAKKKKNTIMKNAGNPIVVEKSRKQFWFEKFIWFISSDNYLVIAGRDHQENEVIVKKYMSPNDIYVHSENHGSSSVVIKNPTANPIPPRTLAEAIQMAMCYSPSWETKVISSAYWVHGNQVSKKAQTGEFLSAGSFMIRGKRNFMKPSAIIYGCGLLFKVAEESICDHVDERKPKFGDESVDQEAAHPKSAIFSISEGQTDGSETYISLGLQKTKPQREIRKSAKAKRAEKKAQNLEVQQQNQEKKRRKVPKKGKNRRRLLDSSDDEANGQNALDALMDLLGQHKIAEEAPVVVVEKVDENEKVENEVVEPAEIEDQESSDDEQAEQLNEVLSSLTGIPKESDEVLFCIPVYAPYSTLSSYKYRAKLQPGQTKRGKAGKTIINGFVSDRSTPEVHRALIRAIKEQDIYRNMPGSVKVSNIKIN